jgi:hypothetical protein
VKKPRPWSFGGFCTVEGLVSGESAKVSLPDRFVYAELMDSLQNLLGKYSPKEPDETIAIKKYIYDTFKVASSVGLQGDSIIITVTSASLANTLRFQVTKLQKAGNTTKRIVFRIG